MPSTKVTARGRMLYLLRMAKRNQTPYAKMKSRMGGFKRFALHGNPATTEGCSLGARNQPREGKAKGARNQPREAKAAGGRRSQELHGSPGSPAGAAKARCTRWHGRKPGEQPCQKCRP